MALFFDNLRATNKETLDKASGMNALDRTIFLDNAKKNGKLQMGQGTDSFLQNTFHTDKDGINYSVGDDGSTYSYELQNNQVTNLKPLTSEEQRAAIRKITNGAVEVDPKVENQQSLTDIFRSVSRMYGKGGNLVPNGVDISDMHPGAYALWSGAEGATLSSHPRDRDEIEINGLDYPELRRSTEEAANSEGWWTDRSNKALGEGVLTHELSHSSQFSAENIVDDWLQKKQEEAKKSKNKYPANELFKKTISDFFGQGYKIDESKSVGAQLLEEVTSKYNKWRDEDDSSGSSNFYDFLDIAAKNAGFDSKKEAAASISGYASQTYPSYYYTEDGDYVYLGDYVNDREVFAEAYTDVLINGDDAAQFSKELVKLWSDYADKWAERTGKNKEKRVKEIKEMFEILPDFKTNPQKTPMDKFRQNYRRLVVNKKQ